MTPELQAAAEDAYAVFSPFAKAFGGKLHVCRCPSCVSPETEKALLGTPLREISSDLLAEYSNSGHGWDDGTIADEFRYYLPRYLDLLAQYDPPDQLGLDGCLRRMGEAQWLSKWPAEQSGCVDAFFDAYLINTLLDVEHAIPGKSRYDTVNIDAVLLCIHRAGGDIGRVLSAWDAAPDPGAAVNMAWMRQKIVWRDGAPDLYGWNEFDGGSDAGSRIAEFLLRPEADERLERAFFTTDDENWQTILSDAAALGRKAKTDGD